MAAIVAVLGMGGVSVWAERAIVAGEDEVMVDAFAVASLILIVVALWWTMGHPPS